MSVPGTYRAFTAGTREGGFGCSVEELETAPLEDGAVRVAVRFSSVNFKDHLAATENARVARIDPIVPGVDLAGEVIESASPDVQIGDLVIAHGYDLGVSRHGGFAELAQVLASWVVPLPRGTSLKQTMIIGTAGFTAALSVKAIVDRGITPSGGPILVTGAAGGVGSVSVALLGQLGYEVHASTGRTERAGWLSDLGAAEVLPRLPEDAKPLGRETWAAAVDSVGGATLHATLASIRYGGTVAASGNTGGAGLQTTVFPFILRAVSLVGIDSVQVPINDRRAVWDWLTGILGAAQYDLLEGRTFGLDEVPEALQAIRRGRTEGRSLIAP